MTAREEHGTYFARLQCHFHLHIPEIIPARPLVALTLHGYGMRPEPMLRLTSELLGADWIVASLQAPNQHYATNPGQGKAVYNWGTRDHWEEAARLHHDIVIGVLSSLRQRFHADPAHCLLIGFSQPVGLNYRFCATFPGQVRGVMALCGGVPRDWEDGNYLPVSASILHVAREEDEYYPPATASDFPRRLRFRAQDVEFHLLAGGHRFPTGAGAVVRPWLERVFPR